MHSSREIIDSDLVVTFFHPLLRDQQEADIRITKMREENTPSNNSNICGEIKFSIHYHRDTFIVMVRFLIFLLHFLTIFVFLDSSCKIIALPSNKWSRT